MAGSITTGNLQNLSAALCYACSTGPFPLWGLQPCPYLAREGGGVVVVRDALEVALHEGPRGQCPRSELGLDLVDGDLQDVAAPEVGWLPWERPIRALLVTRIPTAGVAAAQGITGASQQLSKDLDLLLRAVEDPALSHGGSVSTWPRSCQFRTALTTSFLSWALDK